MRLEDPALLQMLNLLAGQMVEYAILLTDVNGKVVWLSDGAERILGIPEGEAKKQSLARFFTPEDRSRDLHLVEMERALAGSSAIDDRWHLRADGSRFWASGSLVALRGRDDQVIGFGKIIRNRTDMKEQIEALQNQVHALSEANRQGDVTLASVVHELRSPLAPITAAVDMLAMKTGESSESWMTSTIAVMRRQLATMQRMIDDLSEVNRMGIGKVTLRKERVTLQSVLSEAVEVEQPHMRQRKLRFRMIVPSAPIFIECDPVRIKQVFVNLLNNAAKFTHEAGCVWLTGTTEGREAVVYVEDNGEGIPTEMQSRIFELFTQADGSEGRGGLGIGLSLVKALVTLHGGSVQVRSDGAECGAQFTVRLPLPNA